MSSAEERRPEGADGGRDGQRCPECGTSREPGSAPACGCTERAADAARDARSADAAAAEDFDPLRIRPYVTLPEPGPAEGSAPEPGPSPAAVLPPEAAAPPRSADVGLFAAGAASQDGPLPPPLPYDDGPEPRRGRKGLYAGVGAAVAVVAVAVLATFLLTPDKPQRDEALPDAPTHAVDAPSGSATESEPRTATPSRSRSATAEASPTPSAPPSPSASRTASASAKPRTTPPPSRSTARATGSVEPAPPSADGVLRRGDRGPEVKELQQRLRQLYLYMGEPNGNYNTQVADAVTRFQYARGTQGDGQGVYGRETRAALERETSEP
ncbi:hypothetical protein GCM10009837_30560 [Streptomyces durmitorensis]|uniref:Peptidoglycan-binding protein n=1 Tax=Streptomyces durmitorensis TaxID=319947 RepID=A0ABY4Q0T1_9ACTN|nr:peptidoglycan-binding domain-containing protein [Streptomyces durmitorensis]UQT58797.1 peptidoglycan-binding protein [Streptomyces durmitorensis]